MTNKTSHACLSRKSRSVASTWFRSHARSFFSCPLCRSPCRERIYQYYLPVYFWVLAQLQKHKNSSSGPLVVGISAPQGCGKSTLCEQLEALLLADGLTPASLSIDDFYLTRAEQEALAAAHPQNPLLQSRGNAASHDLAIGTRTLAALRDATAASAPVALPRYDKSAFQGKGDRADPATWPSVKGPVDVVLFEGWMLGFTPVSEDAAITVDPHLAPVNEALLAYEAAWDSYVDAWLVVRVSDPQFAYRWRLQAEHAMRAAGRDAMTDDEVAAFVDRFMPAYRCYLPGLYADGPTTAQPGALLVVEVDEGRSPAAVQPTPIM
jgi:D-glycerate 3-kinase